MNKGLAITDKSSSSSFEKIARAYNLLVNEPARWNREKPFHNHYLNQAQKNRNNQPPRILDLGCGTGFHARHFAQSFTTKIVVGLDPSPAMIKVAQSKPGGNLVTWVNAPAENIPRNLGEFDLTLLLGNTLSLIPDTQPIFQSVASVTQPGALFIIQMLDYDQLRKTTTSPKITEKSDDSISIRKTLTIHPQPKQNGQAAALDLIIKSDDGSVLAQDHHILYEHPQSDLLPIARRAGWSLQHQQHSFELSENSENIGSDRVWILIRS